MPWSSLMLCSHKGHLIKEAYSSSRQTLLFTGYPRACSLRQCSCKQCKFCESGSCPPLSTAMVQQRVETLKYLSLSDWVPLPPSSSSSLTALTWLISPFPKSCPVSQDQAIIQVETMVVLSSSLYGHTFLSFPNFQTLFKGHLQGFRPLPSLYSMPQLVMGFCLHPLAGRIRTSGAAPRSHPSETW